MNIRGIYSSVRHRADRYGHAYIRRLRRDLEMVQFLFCLRIWTPPLSIFEAATHHRPCLAVTSVPWRGASSARPPSSQPGRVIHALPRLPDAVAPQPPHSLPLLAPLPPRGHSSQTPPGPPGHNPVHWCHAGPCAGCCRAIELGAAGATGLPSQVPPVPPTPSHGPSSRTSPGPPSHTPVHCHRPPAARRSPNAHRHLANCSPLWTASVWPTAHRRK
jgi:hypothetical protein